jgi:hypothetical protein
MDHFKGGRSRGISSGNNGGVMGSGIFGMFGTTIHCQNSDNSYYCQFMKLIQVVSGILFLFAILYLVYMFAIGFRKK